MINNKTGTLLLVIVMINKSIWIQSVQTKKNPKLKKDISVDVLIIGGGITGLTTAYCLKDSDLKVCLVERDEIAHGVSGKTTGKINYLQEFVYSDLEKKYSFYKAKEYLDSQREAVKRIEDIINKENIKCDFEKVRSYLFTDKEDEIEKLEEEKDLLKKMGVKVIEHKEIDEGVECKYAISVSDTAVFNSVKYLTKLKEIIQKHKVKIYEDTCVYSLEEYKDSYLCKTDHAKIRAKKVVLACHYPFFLKKYFLPARAYLERSYLSASKVNKAKKDTYITSSSPCKSIRYYSDKDKYKLYVSNSHNICNDLNYQSNVKELLNDLKVMNLKPEYMWINEDLITIDRMPYIGRIKKEDSNLLIGTGYNTWGMTNGTLAGFILSDIVLGRKNSYEELFDPLRNEVFVNIDSYIINVLSSAKGYVQNKLFKDKVWYKDILDLKLEKVKVLLYMMMVIQNILYIINVHIWDVV